MLAQDRATIARSEGDQGQDLIAHRRNENTSVVRDKVPIRCESSGLALDDSGHIRRAANPNDTQGRRMEKSRATHDDVRQATQLVGREAIANEKAAQVGDADKTASLVT